MSSEVVLFVEGIIDFSTADLLRRCSLTGDAPTADSMMMVFKSYRRRKMPSSSNGATGVAKTRSSFWLSKVWIVYSAVARWHGRHACRYRVGHGPTSGSWRHAKLSATSSNSNIIT